jgi:drug/metabolite transporter (DMT)-like permease
MHGALVIAAAVVTAVLVGATMVATRFVIDQTDPASLALLRYAVGSACLVPVALASGGIRFARRDVVPICLLGIAQFGILVALLNFGLLHIGAARGALIFSTLPLMTMVLAAALGLERLGRAQVGGVVLTIVGVALALADKLAVAGSGGDTWIGEAAVFASTLTGAVCSVLYRPYVSRYSPLPVGAAAMVASVAFLAGPAAWEGFFAGLPDFTAGGWAAVLFIGGSSGLGYFLWLWALRHATPTKVTVFMALGPITATVLGALLLDEATTTVFLAGLACVAVGLWLAHRRGGAGNGARMVS